MTASGGDHPDVIARPPLIWAACVATGLAFDAAWPSPALPQTVQYVAGAAVFGLGFALAIWAMWRFRAFGTNVPTTRPSTAVVSDGPYRFTRNPIYLAMALGTVGIGLAVDGVWVIGAVVAQLLVMHFGVVRREERYLDGKFGEAYQRYRQSVRRWI